MRTPCLKTNPVFDFSTVVTFPLQRLRSPSRCPTWTSWATLRIACTARMACNPRRRERRGHGSRCGGTWGVSKMVGFNGISCGIHRENWWKFGILWDFIGFGAISSKVVGRRIRPYLSLIQWLMVQTWILVDENGQHVKNMEHMSTEGAYDTGDPGDTGGYTLINGEITNERRKGSGV